MDGAAARSAHTGCDDLICEVDALFVLLEYFFGGLIVGRWAGWYFDLEDCNYFNGTFDLDFWHFVAYGTYADLW